jgi:hypothetical protein
MLAFKSWLLEAIAPKNRTSADQRDPIISRT